MKRIYILVSAVFLFLLPGQLVFGQDFFLYGCHWNDADGSDSLATLAQINVLKQQAPALAYTGFTYLWLPSRERIQKTNYENLIATFRKAGIETISDISFAKDKMLQAPQIAENYRKDFQVKDYRILADKEPDVARIASFINEAHFQNQAPEIIVIDLPEWQHPARLSGLVNKINTLLRPEAVENANVRVFDYPLREALRKACSNASGFDVREIFDQSLRDATPLTGFNVITLVNAAIFQNANNKKNDWDDPIESPLLAYAYTLTNNQVGLPAIFYDDYLAALPEDGETTPNPILLKQSIDQLLKVHRAFIFNSTSIEYLNRIDTDRQSFYLSATEGADATQSLIFQMEGNNTPAGKAEGGHRDVIVALNFSNTTLRVFQEINMSNVRLRDVFTDVLGKSSAEFTTVEDQATYKIPNAIYIELPPRSYSVWVQGEAPRVSPSLVNLSTTPFSTYVEINWEVPAEQDIKGYEVEKSIGSEDQFTKIAWIDAASGVATSTSYLFVDETRDFDQYVFYRIKTVKKDDSFDYSAISEVKAPIKEMSFQLLSGVQAASKAIKIKSNFEDEGTLTVYDSNGNTVITKNHRIRKGTTLLHFELSALPKGVYIAKFVTKRKKNWTERIVHL